MIKLTECQYQTLKDLSGVYLPKDIDGRVFHSLFLKGLVSGSKYQSSLTKKGWDCVDQIEGYAEIPEPKCIVV